MMLVPAGPDDGALPIGQVVAVLERNNVLVTRMGELLCLDSEDTSMDVVVVNANHDGELIHRVVLQAISRFFDIPLTEIYGYPPE